MFNLDNNVFFFKLGTPRIRAGASWQEARLLCATPLTNNKTVEIGRGGGLVDRATDLGQCDPSSIPLCEKKENK